MTPCWLKVAHGRYAIVVLPSVAQSKSQQASVVLYHVWLEYSTRLRSLCVQGSRTVVGLILRFVWIYRLVDSVGCLLLSLLAFRWRVLHILVQVEEGLRIREAVRECRNGCGWRGWCSLLPLGGEMWVPSFVRRIPHQALHRLKTMENIEEY